MPYSKSLNDPLVKSWRFLVRFFSLRYFPHRSIPRRFFLPARFFHHFSLSAGIFPATFLNKEIKQTKSNQANPNRKLNLTICNLTQPNLN